MTGSGSPRIQQAAANALICLTFVALLAGVPLLILPGQSFHYDVAPKAVLLLGGAAVLALFLPYWLDGLRTTGRDRWGKTMVILLVGQVCSLTASTALAEDWRLSFAGSEWRRLGFTTHSAAIVCALALMGAAQINRGLLRSVLRTCSVATAAASIYGISQYFGIDPWINPSVYHEGEGVLEIVRPPSTFGHAGYFATYLLHGLFFACHQAGNRQIGRTERLLNCGTAATALVAIVLSGTRSSLVGIGVGLLFLGWWFRPRIRRRHLLAAGASIIIIIGFFASPAAQKLRRRGEWYVEDAAGGGRLPLWRDSLRLAADFPVRGIGPEAFAGEFSRYRSKQLAQLYPTRRFESAHNVFLDAATAQGIPGLLILAGLVAAGLAAARGRPKRDPVGWLAAGFLAALASNQFLNWTIPTALFFYANLVLLLRTNSTPIKRRPRFSAWAIGLPLAILFAVSATDQWRTDRTLLTVNQALEKANLNQATTAYAQLLEREPWSPRSELWFSRLAMGSLHAGIDPETRGRVRQAAAAAAAQAARLTEQRANALLNLASVQALGNDAAQIEQTLRAAIEAAPTWHSPRIPLARLLATTGRSDEAREQARQALDLSAGKVAEAVELCEQLKCGATAR